MKDALKGRPLYLKNRRSENDLESALTHSRPEPEGMSPTEHPLIFTPELEGMSPTEHPLIFTPEQEEARKAAKNGKLGIKFDEQKMRWDLLPYREVEEIVEILTFGAKKYADNNWQCVPNRRGRYFAAAMRHLVAWFMGERFDKESGKNHLAHALCCVLFLLWDDNEKNKKNDKKENNK